MYMYSSEIIIELISETPKSRDFQNAIFFNYGWRWKPPLSFKGYPLVSMLFFVALGAIGWPPRQGVVGAFLLRAPPLA